MIALTSNFSISYQPEITATTSTFDFGPSVVSPLFLMCDPSYWFTEAEDLRDYLNALRMDGYRKEIFTTKPILANGYTRKEFRKSDYKLKIKHRNWKNKELNN